MSRGRPAPLRCPAAEAGERPHRLPGERPRVPVSFSGSERCRAPAASPGAPCGPGAGTPGLGTVFDPSVLQERQARSGSFRGALPRAGRGGRWGSGGRSSGSSLHLITSNTFLTAEKDGVTIYGISVES